jgi:hypothetical protein
MDGFGHAQLFDPIRYRFRVLAALPAMGRPGDVIEVTAGGFTSLYIWNDSTAAWQAIILNNANVGVAPQDQAYNAGDFDTGTAMTWTVEAGDLLAFRYGLQGGLLYVSLYILSSSIGGVVNTGLRARIPGGFTATRNMRTPIVVIDNGAHGIGAAYVQPASNLISIVRMPVANFTASANNTGIAFQMWIEV